MKNFGKIAAGIAGCLACCTLAHADDSVAPKNPYATIATRNAFRLEPLVVAPTTPSPAEPLPKVLPKGIMTILGQAQVLFNVETLQSSPGTRGKVTSYVLIEGEQQDGIEVIHIDTTTGIVTFNNHGTIQHISLTDSASATRTVMPPPPAQIYRPIQTE